MRGPRPLVRGRHGRLKEQGTKGIVYVMNNEFSFTLLRQGAGATHAKVDALGEKEVTGARIV